MRLLALGLLVMLSGCIDAEVVEPLALEVVAETECPAGRIVDVTLEHRGPQGPEWEHQTFHVPPGCQVIRFVLVDDSTWAGDVDVYVESPSELESHFVNGIGFGHRDGGVAGSANYRGAFSMEPEVGVWVLRAGGTGAFDFHVRAELQ